MRGISAESQAAVLGKLAEAASAGAELTRVGDDLFGVALLLDGNPQLRRAFTDPAAGTEVKHRLVRQLFESKIDPHALACVLDAAGRRWSQVRDQADALERAGAEAHLAGAEQLDQLDDVEDELFRLGRVVGADEELRQAVTDRQAPLQVKQQLVANLIEGKATDATLHLAQHAVSGRHRSFGAALAEFAKLAAARRDRLVATIRVAHPLDEQRLQRLGNALNRQYGRPVHLNVVLDEAVVGGVRVEIGDDIIDGTTATRLEDARRQIAG